MITGHLLAGEGVEITANALHILRNLPRGAPFGALEEQMLDEMADAVDFRRFIAAADAHPEPEADARHVRHFRRRDGNSVFKPGYLIHMMVRPAWAASGCFYQILKNATG